MPFVGGHGVICTAFKRNLTMVDGQWVVNLLKVKSDLNKLKTRTFTYKYSFLLQVLEKCGVEIKRISVQRHYQLLGIGSIFCCCFGDTDCGPMTGFKRYQFRSNLDRKEFSGKVLQLYANRPKCQVHEVSPVQHGSVCSCPGFWNSMVMPVPIPGQVIGRPPSHVNRTPPLVSQSWRTWVLDAFDEYPSQSGVSWQDMCDIGQRNDRVRRAKWLAERSPECKFTDLYTYTRLKMMSTYRVVVQKLIANKKLDL